MISYNVPINAQRMTIGVQGENNVREFLFDVTEWRQLTGDIGTAEMVIQRRGDSSPYAAVITMHDENTVSWIPVSADTAKAGAGKIQLMWIATGQTVKTKIFDMKVDPAIDYQLPDDSLDPWASWVPDVINAAAAMGDLPGTIVDAVADWLEENIEPTTPAVDASLSVSGAAADAKVAGDKVTELKSALNYNHTAEPGYVLRATNTGHGNEWAMVGTPTDAQAATAINTWLDEHPEATTTVQDGALTEPKFSNALKLKTIKDYVTPQMYGATGDGVADDTSAFVDACNSGFPVYVKDCAIGSCEVHDVKICANNMVLKGRIKGHNIDFTGSIDVDGGHFFVDRSTSALAGRDNSIFHEINVNVLSGAYLFDLYGTLYNVKFSNINISGKFTENVIKLRTSTWLTYTSINNCFFGSCDNPIYIDDQSPNHNQIGDIYIRNSCAQKYNPDGACHFVSTNSKGLLVCDGSFMYDLNVDSGDSEIYIRRNSDGVGYFNIVTKNKNINPIVLIADSNGNRGLPLMQEVGYEPGEQNGDSQLGRKFMRNPAFYNFVANGYGIAIDVYMPSDDILGTMYKVGNAISNTNRELVVGMAGSTGKLGSVFRRGTDIEPVKRTYDANEDSRIVSSKAQIDLYGQGVCLFYTPLKKAVFRWGSTYYDAVGNNITADIT